MQKKKKKLYKQESFYRASIILLVENHLMHMDYPLLNRYNFLFFIMY